MVIISCYKVTALLVGLPTVTKHERFYALCPAPLYSTEVVDRLLSSDWTSLRQSRFLSMFGCGVAAVDVAVRSQAAQTSSSR